MKQIELRPIRDRPEYSEKIKSKIIELFKKEFYLPLLEEIGGHSGNSKTLKNSIDDLLESIKSGRITFSNGKFRGRLNSTLSKELRKLGAKWEVKQGCFSLPKAKIPAEVQSAINTSYTRFEDTARRVNRKIDGILPEEIAEKLKIENIFDTTLWKVDNDFNNSVKGITVAPQLTPERRRKIAQEYTENMKLNIKGFLEEEVVQLRKKVQKNLFSGGRYEGMIKTIEESYQVSHNKAKFLARQETNLLVSKFKEARYTDSGIHEYKWKCVIGAPNHPVRPQHQKLNDLSAKGKLFRFDDPPVTTEPGDPQRKNNPGEDFGCRCTSIPVVKFS